MKEKFLGVCLTAVLAGLVAAQEPPTPPETEPTEEAQAGGFHQPMMEPERGPGMMQSEKMQEVFAKRAQRRYEIMILLQAYRIIPEADRAPLEKAIRDRLKEDYDEHQAFNKAMIAKMEKQLAKMKEREAKDDPVAAVDQEFKRLLAAPIPAFMPMGAPEMMGPQNGQRGLMNGGLMQQRGLGRNADFGCRNQEQDGRQNRERRHQGPPEGGQPQFAPPDGGQPAPEPEMNEPQPGPAQGIEQPQE